MSGLVSEMCACGCGQLVQQSGVGRKRKYVNNTHKSTANNQRTKELAKSGLAIKEAVLLRHIVNNMEYEDICLWYPDLTGAQWSVIDAMQKSTVDYDTFITTLSEMAGW